MKPNELAYLLEHGSADDIKALRAYLDNPYHSFCPRPDNRLEFDEQTSFIEDRWPGLACVLGGNGSGKSEAGAYKLCRNLFRTEPPKDLCTIFIASQSLDQASSLWAEKLSRFIPPGMVEHIEWVSHPQNKPKNVVLKAIEGHKGKRWQLCFRSYEQGLKSFSGYSNVAGFWLDEMAPMDIVGELWTRCRESRMPGFKFWTLTPITPMPDLEKLFHEKESNPDAWPDWRFYRLNAASNWANEDKAYLENCPDEMRATKLIGAFCNLSGAVFKDFSAAFHVRTDPFPDQCTHYRCIDFGYVNETACVWAAKTATGRYYVYNEWGGKEMKIEDRVNGIVRQVPEWPKYNAHTYGDTAAASDRNEFAKLGLPTANATKEPKIASIEVVQRLLATQADGLPNLIIHPRCKKLIAQLQAYQWQPAKKDQAPDEKTYRGKWGDDFVDALLMLCRSSQNSIKPWEGLPPQRFFRERA